MDSLPGYRSGHGKPRRVTLCNGTVTVRRPRVRGLHQRLDRLNQLRDQELVGEGRDGKVVLRAMPPQVGDAEVKLLEEENKDREVIITGMAKAILKLNKQQPTSANLANVKKQASETFASLRRDKAQSGWWIQLPEDGSWKKK